MATRRSEFGYGSGRRRTASITENNAVLAPIPSPSVRTATAVNPAFFRNMRIPKRMSFQRVSMQVLGRNILCGCEQRSLKAFAKHRIIQEHAHVERRRVPARFTGPVERWCCARWGRRGMPESKHPVFGFCWNTDRVKPREAKEARAQPTKIKTKDPSTPVSAPQKPTAGFWGPRISRAGETRGNPPPLRMLKR